MSVLHAPHTGPLGKECGRTTSPGPPRATLSWQGVPAIMRKGSDTGLRHGVLLSKPSPSTADCVGRDSIKAWVPWRLQEKRFNCTAKISNFQEPRGHGHFLENTAAAKVGGDIAAGFPVA
ncbi:hypothetical protein NDU88_005234 [Pleurodeles waltl]|uniref:Uncharacterized protein n=1 Tax=Pleurodeles waltl TaxID=8319 RepID=A0AAV7MYN3_PLEWA|nr:hypothetical protein NDU88_005234 [Pleurodeles waltl]